jgi:cell shape-determining protein MreC
MLRKNSDPEVKKLKLKVRKSYNKRKLEQQYQEEMKRLSKQLLLAKRNAQETFLGSILKSEGKCWTEFYKYVKRRKGNRENNPAIKDGNGRLITGSIEKANSLYFYYSSVFSCERCIPQIERANSGELFSISTKIIRKKLAAIGKNK